MSRRDETLPPPLPPETRTVGQLVAETVKLYGRNVWAALATGLAFAAVEQVAAGRTREQQVLALALLGAVLLSGAYAVAVAVVHGLRPGPAAFVRAVATGAVVWLPVPFLLVLFILPALAWLALVGLVVPVMLVERLGARDALARAVRLARADYVHALGSLATLAILFFLVRSAMFFLLRDTADAGGRLGLAIADVVLSPLLFLGAALLYADQAARVRSRP